MYLNCKERGFTLIELIVTITILAIFASIAAPSFQSYMARQEQRNLLTTIRDSVNLSKNNATTLHNKIVICSSSTLSSCENNQWAKGILIFSDLNDNRVFDANDQLQNAVATRIKYGTLVWNGGATNPNTITFMDDTGLPRGAPGSFIYCSDKYNDLNTRYVISPMGHVRTEHSNACS